MTTSIIILLYAALSGLSIRALRRIQFDRPTFIDAHLVGCVFFVSIPILFLFFIGSLQDRFLFATPYDPLIDTTTTLNIFLGWAIILTLQAFQRSRSSHLIRIAPHALGSFAIFLTSYIAVSVISFISAGKLEGGHWLGNLDAGFRESSFLIMIVNFANVYRTCVFGFLLYLVSIRRLSVRDSLLIGAMLVLFDLVLTFNRITIAYFTIYSLIVLRKHFFAVLLSVAICIYPLSYLSDAWTAFRGMALSEGLRLSSIQNAFDSARHEKQASSHDSATILNSVFEASNLTVLNFIVANVPDRMEPLWGETILVRPLTVLLPSSIWREKPVTFGVRLGRIIQGIDGLALNSTLLGEAYGNFYFLWPIGLTVILSLLNFAFHYLGNAQPYYRYFGFFVAFALWRFDMSFATISLVAIISFEVVRRLVLVSAIIFRGGVIKV